MAESSERIPFWIFLDLFGQVELAADLSAAWRLPPVDPEAVTAARVAREARCLCLPKDVAVHVVEDEATSGILLM